MPPTARSRQTPSNPEPDHRRSRLTLRVYKIDAEGTVADNRGEDEILAYEHTDPVPVMSDYPQRTCPRCKTPH
ncbi:hypothetical protein GCM10010256_63940 [Streptomyces coeruleorubidus]|nr:hypothetical protein GCM10010256_63940 [Streptomyces coeruleorubidus]